MGASESKEPGTPDQKAAKLINHTEHLLSKWEERVRDKVLDEPDAASSHILRNNLPDLMHAIATTIRDPEAEITSKVVNVAHSHASERLKLTDFSLINILDEYGLFREVLFEHLQRPEPLSWELQQRINRCIDRSVREATRFFIDRKEAIEAGYKTEREQLLSSLGTANRRLEAVLDQMPIGVMIAEQPRGRLTYFNQAAQAILGHPISLSDDYQGYDQNGALHPDRRPYRAEEYPLARAVVRGEHVSDEEMLYQRGDGHIINLTMHAAPVSIADDEPNLAVVMFYDTSALRETQAALAQEQEFARVTLEAMGDGVITTDDEGRIERMNPAAERLTGWARPSAEQQRVVDVVRLLEEDGKTPAALPVSSCIAENRQDETPSMFLLSHRTEGGTTPVTYNLAPIHGAKGQVIGSVTIIHDATLQWRQLQEMSYEAQHDALTGLVNRREFIRRLRLLLDRVKEDGEPAALLYLDLDQFKTINDNCGHTAGDALLIQLANLLREHIRDQDTLARLGGDEFAVILEHCHLKNALDIANSLRETVKGFVFHWNKEPFRIGVSIGLLEINQEARQVSTLIKRADEACYQAKEAGRNRVHVAEPPGPGTRPAKPRTNWAALVEAAIEKDQLELLGQKIVPLSGSAGEGIEFLVRLPGPDRMMAKPAAFMPSAERHNLMPALDYWVVDHALRWLRARNDQIGRFEVYMINVSAYTVSSYPAQERILNLLEEPGIDPGLICFEITELAGTRNLGEASQFLARLKALGYRVSLEDVGGGSASFSHLKQLKVDFLKIDGSFVEGMTSDANDLALVRSINEVGHIFCTRTIAKFVNDPETLEQLRAMGVDYAQGYFIGSPEPLEALWAGE